MDSSSKLTTVHKVLDGLKSLSISDGKPTGKDDIRLQIWNLMEMEKHLKDYPESCHGKIPNFKAAGRAAVKLCWLREFQNARCVKVNPSLAQMHIRFLTLKNGKTLLVPHPSLSEGFMYLVNPKELRHKWHIKRASSKAGSKELGRVFTTKDCQTQIDLYVVGSVACSTNGVRLGKGFGYAEIEWAILFEMGCVTENTVVATTVHDCQVLANNTLPTSLLSSYDLPVDIIVTPTRILNVRRKLKKPTDGVHWELITQKHLEEIPILKQLHLQKSEEKC